MFNPALEYLSVFVASAVNMNYGVGLSATYGLSPFELFLFLSTGSVTGVVVTLLLGSTLREWWRNKFGHPNDESRTSIVLKVWRRYGLIGLAFISCIMGPIPAVAIALLSGMERRRILIYLGCGKFLWSFVFSFLGYGHLQRILAAIF